MKRRYFVAMTIALVIMSACVYNSRVEVPTDDTQTIQHTSGVAKTYQLPTAGVATTILTSSFEINEAKTYQLPTAGVATILISSFEINEVEKTTSASEPTEESQPTQETEDSHDYMSYDWSSDDAYLLAKIAMAEAEGEDTEGKALVVMVVLNRVYSDEFPDTIYDVIYQKKQFSPVSNSRFDKIEPNEDCYKALDMIQLDKWNESEGALYFESEGCTDNWHSRHLEYLFTHGGHRFYK